jgi:mono/diheme cytochrome c family protein
MTIKTLVTAGCVGLLLAPGACGGRENAEQAPRADTAAAAQAVASPDSARLREVYGQIDSTYDSLVARYASMSSQLSTEERDLFESMREMHTQSASVRQMAMGGPSMGAPGMTGGRGMMGGSGMMQGSGSAGIAAAAAREWDQQMQSMHQAMAAMFQQTGAQDMAARHQRMAQLYGQALDYSPQGSTAAPEATGAAPEVTGGAQPSSRGAYVYAQNCATCHGADGQGITGVFPPMTDSVLIAGDSDKLIRIVLHGLSGPLQVNGDSFDGVMPAFGARLTDRQLAAALSYVRTRYANGASAVETGGVGAVRQADGGRVAAMTPDELK